MAPFSSSSSSSSSSSFPSFLHLFTHTFTHSLLHPRPLSCFFFGPQCLPILEGYAKDSSRVVRESCIVALDMHEVRHGDVTEQHLSLFFFASFVCRFACLLLLNPAVLVSFCSFPLLLLLLLLVCAIGFTARKLWGVSVCSINCQLMRSVRVAAC